MHHHYVVKLICTELDLTQTVHVQIPLHLHDIVDIPLQELYAEWIDEEISADTTTSVD